ncbi:MAG: NUDIX domain-containing protein [Pseudomonadota bacterium]|nr:NUDIX domain-containing protein [Pseudomonadota bacterium]
MSGNEDWLLQARRTATAPVSQARRTLLLVHNGAEHAIGSIEPGLADRMRSAGFLEDETTSGFRLFGRGDESLAVVARWLHGRGLGSIWRDELLAVTDAEGRRVGAIERAAVRPLGIKTWAVHLVGGASDQRVWVQQRAFGKATEPGQWDTLMGGQVAAGESIEASLERETWEEAGLMLAELHGLARCEPVIVRRPVADGWVIEDIEVFRAEIADGVEPVNRDGEVERFECLEESALIDRLRAGAFTLEATLILGAELERRAALKGD